MDQNNLKSSDEIDLIAVVKRLIYSFVSTLKTYTAILLRNAILFISILLVFGLIGFSLRFFIPRYFRTQAVYVAHYLPSNMYAILINDLSALAQSGKNASVLAEQLKITEKAAASIHAIETEPLNNVDFQFKNDTTAANVFRVIVMLKDVGPLKEIQDGLKNYLENNEYSVKRKNARIKTLQLLRSDLVQKKNSLDSLQEIMNKPGMPKVSGQVVLMPQASLPMEAYKIEQDYNTRLLQVEQELDVAENIEIVEPFLKLTAPNTPDFKRYFILSVVLGLLSAMVLTPLFGTSRE